MSWDISIFAAAAPPPSVEEMPSDWQGASLGALGEVRSILESSLPGVTWESPSWGQFHGDGFSYDLNLGEEDPCTGFMVHVRGSGNVVSPLLELCRPRNWYLLDVSEGEWLHHREDPEAGWVGFRAYRDSVLGAVLA